MNQTVKFKQPVPFFQIRKAIKKVIDEYLRTGDLDEFSRMIWKHNMDEFYKESSFVLISPDLKRVFRNKTYPMYRDYDYSDLHTRDFILIDAGLPGRILLCDDGIHGPNIVKHISKDDVFTGIQYRISETYDFTDEEKEEWFGRLEGIITFILNELEQVPKKWIRFLIHFFKYLKSKPIDSLSNIHILQ